LINDNEFQTTIDRLDIDDNFKGILRKMTEIAPEDRFQDLKDIEKLLNSNQITQPSNKEIKEEPKKESSKSKSWFNIIALVLSITLLGLGGYAYKIIKDNKENTKTVQQKTQIEVSTIDKKDKAEEEEIKQEIKPLSIPELSEDEVEKEKRVEEDSKIKEDESIEIVATPKPTLIPKNPNTISLGTMIQAGTLPPLSDKKYTPISNRGEIRNFLLAFMKSSEGNSITNLLSYYDYHIDKYFSWRNITHRDIYRDKLRYNKKWVQREFKLISFDILNKYQKNGIEYFNIQKTIQYRVVSANGKIAKGTSKVRMTLKYTNNGFKVTSIYSIK